MTARRAPLWSSEGEAWRIELDRYEQVVKAQGVGRLPELDTWYRNELPASIADRSPPHAVHEDMVRVTEWKMARGVWRAPNLVRVRGNAAADVVRISAAAFRLAPDPRSPIAKLSELDGVGPATASALMAAYRPDVYPFFDELVAAQVAGLGTVAWTPAYYAKYAAALRDRAESLGSGWTADAVARALWAHSGGKAGVHT